MSSNPEYYIHDGSHVKVTILVENFQGLSIGCVHIGEKKQFVVRWDYGEKGYPTAHGHPTWLILPAGLKLVIDPEL